MSARRRRRGIRGRARTVVFALLIAGAMAQAAVVAWSVSRPAEDVALAPVGDLDEIPELEPLASLGEEWSPTRDAVRAARRFATHREGTVAFAVVDQHGPPRGAGLDRGYPSASISKAMLLVAYLRQLHRSDAALEDSGRALLEPMIAYSDNEAASQIQALLEPGALERLAERVGMESFSYSRNWANAAVTASDQARFFLRVDRLVPPPYRSYARGLLQDIVPKQSWGILEAARPRWSVLFKGGWRPELSGALVHQAALLEHGDRRLAIAVLSEGSPDHEYGTETVRGIAARLLEGTRRWSGATESPRATASAESWGRDGPPDSDGAAP